MEKKTKHGGQLLFLSIMNYVKEFQLEAVTDNCIPTGHKENRVLVG
jgi:hypothetical protein